MDRERRRDRWIERVHKPTCISVELDCSRVRCATQTRLSCPLDSYVKLGGYREGQCCPEADHCQCPECNRRGEGSVCGGVYRNERVIVEGRGTPGHCCDVVECVGECV